MRHSLRTSRPRSMGAMGRGHLARERRTEVAMLRIVCRGKMLSRRAIFRENIELAGWKPARRELLSRRHRAGELLWMEMKRSFARIQAGEATHRYIPEDLRQAGWKPAVRGRLPRRAIFGD